MMIFVNGFQEAEKYPVLYGQSELMVDNNKDVFYIKAVDPSGKYQMSTYEFRQIENEKPITTSDFVTKQQFVSLEQKMDKLLNELLGTTNKEVNSHGE